MLTMKEEEIKRNIEMIKKTLGNIFLDLVKV